MDLINTILPVVTKNPPIYLSPVHALRFFLGKRHHRVHPGHFPTREGENERRPISCAHSSWIKRSTLLYRKMTWVHPVVSFPHFFLSQCKFSTLTTRQPMVKIYLLLTFSRFPLRKKQYKACFDKKRTRDFRTSRLPTRPLGRRGLKK